MKLSVSTASGVLAGLWIVSLVTSLAIAAMRASRGIIGADYLLQALEDLGGVYAPYVGTILAFYFTARLSRAHAREVRMASFVVAAVVSLLWNAIVVGVVAVGPMENAFKVIQGVPRQLAWLVAPVIGHFFAAGHQPGAK